MMSIDDLPVATAAILDAAMKGVIPAHIGVDLAKLVTIHASALRDVELHQRLKALEGAIRDDQSKQSSASDRPA